jgi:hypothetical protein
MKMKTSQAGLANPFHPSEQIRQGTVLAAG